MLDSKEILEYKALKKKFPNISSVEKKKLGTLERKIIEERGARDKPLSEFVKRLIGVN